MEKDNRKYLNLVNSIALGNLDNLKKLNQEHKSKLFSFLDVLL